MKGSSVISILLIWRCWPPSPRCSLSSCSALTSLAASTLRGKRPSTGSLEHRYWCQSRDTSSVFHAREPIDPGSFVVDFTRDPDEATSTAVKGVVGLCVERAPALSEEAVGGVLACIAGRWHHPRRGSAIEARMIQCFHEAPDRAAHNRHFARHEGRASRACLELGIRPLKPGEERPDDYFVVSHVTGKPVVKDRNATVPKSAN